MHTKRHFSHAKIKGKQWSQNKKSITIKVPAELKKQIDDQRKLTGQTISQIVERAVVNLLNAEPGPSLSNANHQ
jgi:hypothetical protein